MEREAGGGFDGERRAMAFTTCLFWMRRGLGCACADGWMGPGSRAQVEDLDSCSGSTLGHIYYRFFRCD
jgi:hypothetical protein